ncbi:NAD(P)-binding protein [Trametopsis cervina]|nr:NAD(P)-binding protein [Trametopsis cervina]
MKVLIFGAAGFVGFPVAQALLRAGHTVYGQTRTAERANLLASNEITPIIAEATDVSAWEFLIADVDVIIEALAGQTLNTLSPAVFEAVTTAIQKHRPAYADKVTFIYTSGAWVWGDDRNKIITDTTAPSKPLSIVAWRPAVEQNILKSEIVNSVVIRPTLVYGRSSSLLGLAFQRAYEGKLTWPGTPGGRLAVIHQDDLADLYVRAAENGPSVKGLSFAASEDKTESTDDVLAKIAKIAGNQQPFEYTTPSNPFEEGLGATVLVRPYLARAVLGWVPRKHGIVEDLELYYSTWKATAGLS